MITATFGWIGTVLLFLGIYLVGEKQRIGFALAAVGEVLWMVKSAAMFELDLFVLSTVFAILQVVNWSKWK